MCLAEIACLMVNLDTNPGVMTTCPIKLKQGYRGYLHLSFVTKFQCIEKLRNEGICWSHEHNLMTQGIFYFIIWLNWSKVKRSILIGSLSGPNFAIRTAKMDRSRTEFTDLCS